MNLGYVVSDFSFLAQNAVDKKFHIIQIWAPVYIQQLYTDLGMSKL